MELVTSSTNKAMAASTQIASSRRSLRLSLLALVAVSALMFLPASASLIIHDTEDMKFLIAQEWFDGSTEMNGSISGNLTNFTSPDALIPDAIILMVTPNGLYEEMHSHILRMQRLGAAAIVAQVTPGEATAGRTMFQTTIGMTKDATIPFFTANEENFRGIIKGKGLLATITPTGNDNYWKASNRHPAIQVWYSLVAVASLASLGLSIQRLGVYVKSKGWRKSTALFALIMNIIGTFFAMIHWAVDPDGTRQLFSRPLRTIALTFAIPFIFSSCLLVLLYWLELLTMKDLTPVIILKRLRIPYFCLAAYFVAFEVISAGFRAVFWGLWGAVSTIGSLFINLIILITTIFVLIAKINKAKSRGTLENPKMESMRRKMIAIAVFSILAIVFLGLYAYFQYQPYYSQMILGMEAFIVIAVSMTNTLMFNGKMSRTKRVVVTGGSSGKLTGGTESTLNKSSKSSSNLESVKSSKSLSSKGESKIDSKTDSKTDSKMASSVVVDSVEESVEVGADASEPQLVVKTSKKGAETIKKSHKKSSSSSSSSKGQDDQASVSLSSSSHSPSPSEESKSTGSDSGSKSESKSKSGSESASGKSVKWDATTESKSA